MTATRFRACGPVAAGRGGRLTFQGGHKDQGGGSRGQSDSSLKKREYRDKDGQVRHHTRAYMEQHGGKK